MEKLARSHVFLTGATGTIGRAVLSALMTSGRYDVTCLVRSADAEAMVQSLGAAAIRGAMEDAALFEQLAARLRCDYVIHTAQAHYSVHSDEEINRLDRLAVANLERLRTAATRLMIYTSGVWVYGAMAAGRKISGHSPLHPFDAAQRRAELLATQVRRTGTPWLELCPPSIVYGRQGSLPRIVGHLRERDLETIDDSAVLWSLISADDLAAAFVAALAHGRAGEVFPVAEENAVGVIDFYEAIAAQVQRGKIVRRSRSHWESVLPSATVHRMYASQPVDASAFREATGWQAAREFRTALPGLIV